MDSGRRDWVSEMDLVNIYVINFHVSVRTTRRFLLFVYFVKWVKYLFSSRFNIKWYVAGIINRVGEQGLGVEEGGEGWCRGKAIDIDFTDGFHGGLIFYLVFIEGLSQFGYVYFTFNVSTYRVA